VDDPLLTIAAVFPFVLACVGAGFVWWAAHTRLPADVESEVLAALSNSEALPVLVICRRARVADPTTVESALEHLRQTGRAVRWVSREPRETVYRRVA
jgi:hypothetical protein